VVLVAIVAAGCSDTGSGDAKSTNAAAKSKQQADTFEAVAFTGAGADFYKVPDPLPDVPHGTLLRYEQLDTKIDGGTAYRVMYASESVQGEPIAVTGEVAIPTGTPPAEGWKLLSVAHGTTGIADDCAPSKESGDSYLALASSAVQSGYAVAISDYEGLGTPGVHPYLVGESEGRGVVDAAITAHQLPDAKVSKRYAIWGYSQGGHGAAWADQIAADWAPDLDLLGTVAGAPPSEMKTIVSALGSTGASTGFFFMIIAGYHQAYPELDVHEILTDAGVKVLDQVDSSCDAIGKAVGDQPMSSLVQKDFASAEDWTKVLDENDPGRVRVDAPLLILHSGQDDLVPAALSQLMFNRMCENGWTVERRVYNKGQGHGGAVPDAVKDGMAWIGDLFAGKPAKSTCPAG
jgi:alpha-beta hydrolase superfamily lysophospholipase